MRFNPFRRMVDAVDFRFGHPVRGTVRQRISDNVRRWWAYNVADPSPTTWIGRLYQRFRPTKYRWTSAEDLARQMTADLQAAGITDDDIFGRLPVKPA